MKQRVDKQMKRFLLPTYVFSTNVLLYKYDTQT